MSKSPVPHIQQPKKNASGKYVRLKKTTSHGTFRCKRHPNSPRCRNATNS